MVISDQIPCFAGVTVGIFRTDGRYFVDVVQQIKGVADATVDIVIGTPARTIRSPSPEIGDIGVFLAVNKALTGKPIGSTYSTCH